MMKKVIAFASFVLLMSVQSVSAVSSFFEGKVRACFCACAAISLLVAGATGVQAAPVAVVAFGDQGWRSDDTRTSTGVNLIGITSTHAGKPGQVPTAADDTLIAQQIQFVTGPAGSTYGGAVSIDGTATSSGKSNYSVISPVTGFGAASGLLTPDFFVEYEMYKQHTSGGSTLAFKLGVQSSDWAASQGVSLANPAGFTAIRSGESAWDFVLVHVPTVVNNVWTTINLDHDTGMWSLFRQAGNAYFATNPGTLGAMTLDAWAQDTTFGNLLFGQGSVVSSVQFGLGSGQPIAIGYVDYLQTNLLNGGDVIDFGVLIIPEPASASLLLVAGAAMLRRRRRTMA